MANQSKSLKLTNNQPIDRQFIATHRTIYAKILPNFQQTCAKSTQNLQKLCKIVAKWRKPFAFLCHFGENIGLKHSVLILLSSTNTIL
ncbi:hypothetical protein [Moraxella caviae]|uniref:hypothetical protein n=1 Tax=Moraxella caviae TaxID=34060 RepID=UPI000E1BCA0B|nr:hypothetical protein [Moraxella caviae]